MSVLICLGLVDDPDDQVFDTTNRFIYLDGSDNEFYKVNVGQFPWDNENDFGRPEPDFTFAQEFCVEYDLEENVFRDIFCDNDRLVLCEFPCISPAVSPSNSPSIFPSGNGNNPGFKTVQYALLGTAAVIILSLVLLFRASHSKSREIRMLVDMKSIQRLDNFRN